ncbi:MAG TPA: DUF2520 domain-containing protein [Thermoanaerobaculia bacterium]
MSQEQPLPALTLVGPGRAGTTLARCWKSAGGRIEAILARRGEAAQTLASEVGARAGSLEDPGLDPADLLVLAVPDDAIADVAARLAPRLPARTVFHLSGARPAEDLAPFARRGARIASVHPLLPFTGTPGETWNGAVVAVEGDEEGLRQGEAAARGLGARPHRLPAHAKALYHLGATLAAGGSMALLSMATSLWEEAGIAGREARPALAGLAEHAARAYGTARDAAAAFTGPLARRDLETIRAHWRALSRHPELAAVYAALARETLRKTPGLGLETEILRMLEASPER